MPLQKIQGSQHDFSFGEIDVALKRADEPTRRARPACARWPMPASSIPAQSRTVPAGERCSRPPPSRVPKRSRCHPATTSSLAFGNGLLTVFNAAGTGRQLHDAGRRRAFCRGHFRHRGQCRLRADRPFDLPNIFAGMRPRSSRGTASRHGRLRITTNLWSAARSARRSIGSAHRASPCCRARKAAAPRWLPVQRRVQGRSYRHPHALRRPPDADHGSFKQHNATVTIEESLPGSQQDQLPDRPPRTTYSIGDVVNGSVSGARDRHQQQRHLDLRPVDE
jgi:hypothetical protein